MMILGNENRTKSVKKIDWTSAIKINQRSLFELNRKLISFRKSSEAIKSNNIKFFHCDSKTHILGYSRWSNESDESIVVLLNFSMKDQQNYSFLNWPKVGLWKELFSQTTIEIDQSNELMIDLKSYEYRIFLFEK